MGRYNIDPQEVCIQISTDKLCWTSDGVPRGVEVPHEDRPRSCRIHGPSGVGFSKQDYVKTTRKGKHLREAEEVTGPRSQEGRAKEPEPERNDIQIHRTLLACSKHMVESLITGEALYTSEHRACVQKSRRNK